MSHKNKGNKNLRIFFVIFLTTLILGSFFIFFLSSDYISKKQRRAAAAPAVFRPGYAQDLGYRYPAEKGFQFTHRFQHAV